MTNDRVKIRELGAGCCLSFRLLKLLTFPLFLSALMLAAKAPEALSSEAKASPAGKAQSAGMNAGNSKTNKATANATKKDEFTPIISWSEPGVTAWTALLCLHGLGLHKGVYEPFARQMARLGVHTYAIDLRGFGAWKNAPYGNTLDPKESLADIERVLKTIREQNPGLPVVLLGESMGGATAIQAASFYPELVDGLVACVPSGMRYSSHSESMKTAVGLMCGPGKPMNLGPDLVRRVTEKSQLQQSWMNDPKARFLVSPKELIRFQNFMNNTGNRCTKIKDIPVLMVQGGQDKLVKASGTTDLFRRLSSQHKDLVVLGTSEHLIFENGQFDEQVVSVVSSWLLKNVAARDNSSEEANTASLNAADKTVSMKDKEVLNFNPIAQQQATGHFFLAQGFLRLKMRDDARTHFQEVIRIAPKSLLAGDSRIMLNTALKQKTETRLPANQDIEKIEPRFVSRQTAMDNPMPTIMTIETKWLYPRPEIQKVLKQLQANYSGKLNLVRLDADAPENQTLIKDLQITSIPTFLFMNGANEVLDTRLGCTDARDLLEGLDKILPVPLASGQDKR